MKKELVFKIIFTVAFIAMAILKICNEWFNSKIDITFISLIIISFLPWVSRYLKSIEAFGVKAEFLSESKKEKMDNEAEKVVKSNKILEKEIKMKLEENSQNLTAPNLLDTINNVSDPVEKMVLIRHEIEKYLRNIYVLKIGENKKYINVRYMTEELYNNKVIPSEVRNLIFDLMPVLNAAVHANISIKEYDDVMWVIEKGILIIDYLNIVHEKIK